MEYDLNGIPVLLSFKDVLLAPILSLTLLVIARNIWLYKLKALIPFGYIKAALIARLLSCCVGLYITIYVYKGGADTVLYYQRVTGLRVAVENNPSILYRLFVSSAAEISDLADKDPDYDYIANRPIQRVGLFALPFSYIFFNSYLCISFCFTFFSLIGSLCLYKFFIRFYPDLGNPIALATIFLPSIFFWTSGFGKDALSFGAMGIFTYYSYKIIFIKNHKFNSLILTFLGAYIIFTIKPYILFALLPGFLILIYHSFKQKLESRAAKFFAPLLVLAALTLLIFIGNQALRQSSRDDVKRFSGDQILEEAKNQAASYSGLEAGSNFTLGNFEPTFSGILKLFPSALLTGLFRPFPWEIRNFLLALSSLENVFLLGFTFYILARMNIFNLFIIIFKTPLLLFCFVFTIFFTIGITLSTANFGTLVRYRIPMLPFYMMFLFGLQYKLKNRKNTNKNALLLPG